jgi:uncharacterized protein
MLSDDAEYVGDGSLGHRRSLGGVCGGDRLGAIAIGGCIAVCFLLSFVSLIVAARAADRDIPALPAGTMRTVAFRLKPGEDLIAGIMQRVASRQLQAAWISTCVGSLSQWAIRFANQPGIDVGQGHFEIVSLVGTMTSNGGGQHHLHISIGDGAGKTISGHLAANSTIYTTAEIVVGYDCDVVFTRAVDGTTPWDELQIADGRWC